MFRSYGIAVFAVVGWLGFVLTADAQQTASPTLEGKPVPPAQSPDSPGNRKDSSAKEQANTRDPTPALEKIESAIREMIPKPDETQNQRQENREVADLKAQQDMAFWAKLMLWASTASIAFTFVGLGLIWRTLHHTRRTADYAKEAVETSRQIGEAQIRAYLRCRSATYQITEDTVLAILDIENVGQSPAQSVQIKGSVNIYAVGGRPTMPRVLAWAASEKSSVDCQPVMSGRAITEKIHFFWPMDFPVEDEPDRELRKHVVDSGNEIGFDLTVHWTDVFEHRHSFTVDLTAGIDAGPATPRMKKRKTTGDLEFRVSDFSRERDVDP